MKLGVNWVPYNFNGQQIHVLHDDLIDLLSKYELIVHRTQCQLMENEENLIIKNPLGKPVNVTITDDIEYISKVGVNILEPFMSFDNAGSIKNSGIFFKATLCEQL